MTGPQLKDGYTKIANELLEELIRFDFSKRQYKVVMALVRKTYGYGKKFDDITVTQLADMTGLTLSHASECVSDLVAMNVFLKQEGKYGFRLALSKNYRNWKKAPKTGRVPKTGTSGSRNGNIGFPKRETQNKTPKENPNNGAEAPTWSELWLAVKAKGVPGSLLGKLAKEHGTDALEIAVARTLQADPAEPKSYLCSLLRKPEEPDFMVGAI